MMQTVRATGFLSSLPHRQLRKIVLIDARNLGSSLPHRQLRNGQPWPADLAGVFTAAQAAQKAFVQRMQDIAMFTAAQAAQKA